MAQISQHRSRMNPRFLIGFLIGLVVLLATGLGLCLFDKIRNKTVTIYITQEMIDSALAEKFPKEKTYLKIVRVTYAKPRAVLLPDQEKVRVSLDMKVTVGITGFEKTYTGSASMTTRVNYHPADYRFYLEEPELQTLEVASLPENYRETLREGINLIAGEFVDKVPVYKLTKNDTQTNLAKLLLKDVAIRKDKVVVTLGL